MTSEGVNVFLDEALQAMGIDPRKDTFSVKITGGPDGDVAGNEILILNREYGDNVKIVGIADGTGVAEDPEGLDMEELLRLVAASEPIASFDRSKLGNDGVLMDVSTPEGVQRRNTMAFRVRATAFVPAGGRPATINESNYKDFLYEDEETGKTLPSSKLVVEGGELWTDWACAEGALLGPLLFSSLLFSSRRNLHVKPETQTSQPLHHSRGKRAPLQGSRYSHCQGLERKQVRGHLLQLRDPLFLPHHAGGVPREQGGHCRRRPHEAAGACACRGKAPPSRVRKGHVGLPAPRLAAHLRRHHQDARHDLREPCGRGWCRQMEEEEEDEEEEERCKPRQLSYSPRRTHKTSDLPATPTANRWAKKKTIK